METNLIPSMKETLFNPAVSNMGDILIDIAELGLDSILDNNMLRDIPVLGTIVALCNTGTNLRERNLIRQTAIFITSFNNRSIDSIKLNTYRKKLEENPKKMEKELGRVILLLDRTLEEKQAQNLGNFYSSYVKGAISWEKFVELTEVNERIFVADIDELKSIGNCSISQSEEISDARMYQIQRLESLGLVTENTYRLHSGNILEYSGTDDRFVLTPLGKTFYNLM
jgi:hypothetical protein